MRKVSLKAVSQRQKNDPKDERTRDVTETGPRRNPQSPSHGPSLGACEHRNGHPVIGKDRVKEGYQKSGQQEQQQRRRHEELP